ncbi:MAG: SRPBCC family protein [Steroidobacteraceae bacterium]
MIVTMGRKLRRWPLWMLLCFAMQSHAAQVSEVRVTRSGERFLIDMHMVIDAPASEVFRALQDYATMARYNPDLRSVRVELTAAPDRVHLFTTVHLCVLVFCKTMHQEQIMTATASADGGSLDARLVPRGGDFKGGHGQWMVRPCPSARAATCMDVRIQLLPAFWVPPVIGPWVLRRKMDDEARRTGAGLELTARAMAAAPGARRPNRPPI